MLTWSVVLHGSSAGASLERLRGLQEGLGTRHNHVASLQAWPGCLTGGRETESFITKGLLSYTQCVWIQLHKPAFCLLIFKKFLDVPCF